MKTFGHLLMVTLFLLISAGTPLPEGLEQGFFDIKWENRSVHRIRRRRDRRSIVSSRRYGDRRHKVENIESAR